jgi:hypothetical protein
LHDDTQLTGTRVDELQVGTLSRGDVQSRRHDRQVQRGSIGHGQEIFVEQCHRSPVDPCAHRVHEFAAGRANLLVDQVLLAMSAIPRPLRECPPALLSDAIESGFEPNGHNSIFPSSEAAAKPTARADREDS